MYKLKNVLPEYILLILYNSHISSHLNYGLFVWGIKADRLEILQKKAVQECSAYAPSPPQAFPIFSDLDAL